MFDKFFVGGDVISFAENGVYKPVSRVTLLLDDSTSITAGDDTGREIVANCPYATQEMVDALLASLKGYEYQSYEAGAANIDPAAEIGDGIIVGGIYSVIASLRDEGDGYASVAAPGKAELEDEYPIDGPMTQMINRGLKEVGSRITKTATEIRAEVSREINGYTDEEGNFVNGLKQIISSVELNQNGFFARVEGALGTNEDGSLMEVSSSIAATLKGLKFSTSSQEGSSTITLEGGDVKIKSDAFDVTVKAANIVGKLAIGQLEDGIIPDISGLVTSDDIADFITATDLGSAGTVIIDGGRIAADSIISDSLHLGGILSVYNAKKSKVLGGYLGYDSGFNSDSGIGVRSVNEKAQMVCTEQASRISYGSGNSITQAVCREKSLLLGGSTLIQFAIGGTTLANIDSSGFTPASQSFTLGTSDAKWSDVYAAGTSFSDIVARLEALEEKVG